MIGLVSGRGRRARGTSRVGAAAVGVVLLFFVSGGRLPAQEGGAGATSAPPTDRSDPTDRAVATAAAHTGSIEELRLAVETLRAQNDELQRNLLQRGAQVRVLTEQLAIARTESELFQKRWAEAQLQAQTLGIDFVDHDAKHWQRQIVESVRSLYLAEAERQRLIEQIKQLIVAAGENGDLTGAVARARQTVLASEQPTEGSAAKTATLLSAEVLDVNPQLRVVVINVGSEQGVRVGMPFVVLRHDRVVAELRAIEVRRNICGALIETVDDDLTLQAGDEVRVTKS